VVVVRHMPVGWGSLISTCLIPSLLMSPLCIEAALRLFLFPVLKFVVACRRVERQGLEL
jgi:hypothetical protein